MQHSARLSFTSWTCKPASVNYRRGANVLFTPKHGQTGRGCESAPLALVLHAKIKNLHIQKTLYDSSVSGEFLFPCSLLS